MAMKATASVGDIAEKDKESIAETLEEEPGVREYGFSDDGVYAEVSPNEVERKQLLKKSSRSTGTTTRTASGPRYRP